MTIDSLVTTGSLSSMLDFAMIGLALIDQSGTIVLANDTVSSQYFELPVCGRRLTDCFRSPSQEIISRSLESAMQGRREILEDKLVLESGKILPTRMTLVPYGSDGSSPTSIIVRIQDTTQEIRGQEDLSAAHEAVQKALSAKSLFLAKMTHELRTPLNAIL